MIIGRGTILVPSAAHYTQWTKMAVSGAFFHTKQQFWSSRRESRQPQTLHVAQSISRYRNSSLIIIKVIIKETLCHIQIIAAIGLISDDIYISLWVGLHIISQKYDDR